MDVFSKAKKKCSEKSGIALYYIFSPNLFKFWLTRRQLDSYTCFCIQTIALSYII